MGSCPDAALEYDWVRIRNIQAWLNTQARVWIQVWGAVHVCTPVHVHTPVHVRTKL